MHLIGPLAAGIRGAPNGTAELYRRGTSTRLTYYTDFEGQSPAATGENVQLDANGGAVVYVGEVARVVVRDADGTMVRDFTASISAKAVQYSGPSFTGTNVETSEAQTNAPLALSDALDSWFESAGAADFLVYNGSGTVNLSAVATQQAALAATFAQTLSSVVTYGAVGDGVTDDSAAIAAAIAAGGTVVFPPGTYRITTSALTLPSNVHFQGSGYASTAIVQDTASVPVLSVTSTASAAQVLGIAFRHASAASATVPEVSISNGAKARFQSCEFGSSDRYTD